MKMFISIALTMTLVLAAAPPVRQQKDAKSRAAFEVVSIKLNNNLARTTMNIKGNRFVATGMPMRPLIMESYQLRDYQISGGPAWLNTDQWDFDARAPQGVVLPALFQIGAPQPSLSMQMLQAMIEERFQFRYHRESKEVPVYQLAIAPGGLKIRQAAPGAPPSVDITGGRIDLRAQPLAAFVYMLSRQLDRPLTANLNLDGLYDFTLRWTRNVPPGGDPPSDPPVLFTAIQEQLGLRLESARGPVEIMVIDSIQKPVD